LFSSLTLSRFQGFDNTVDVGLRPLTLIFGPNASGKSSVIRALLLLKQSFGAFRLGEWGQRGFLFEGPDISLASFANVVHKHDEKSTIELGFAIENAHADTAPYLGGARYSDLRVKTVGVTFQLSANNPLMGIRLNFDLDKASEPVTLEFEYVDGELKCVLATGLAGLADALEDARLERSLLREQLANGNVLDSAGDTEATGRSIPSIQSRLESLPNAMGSTSQLFQEQFGLASDLTGPVLDTDLLAELLSTSTFRFTQNFPIFSEHEAEAHRENAARQITRLVDIARLETRRQFRSYSSVGPLRTIAERLSYTAGMHREDDDIEAYRGQNSTKGDPVKSVETQASIWLHKLTNGRYSFQPVQFYAENVRFLGSLSSKIIMDNHTGTPVTFADVGVGLSQVLPILEGLAHLELTGSDRGLLSVEQPELHLHPAMQGELADLFIDSVIRNKGLQIIAETHSESILLRVQKRIRDGHLPPDLVRILYVDKSESGNVVQSLEMNPDNDYGLDFPLSFSRVRLEDLI
jgi:hypothetical protein